MQFKFLTPVLCVLCIGGFFNLGRLAAATSTVSPTMTASAVYSVLQALKPGDVCQFHGGAYPYGIPSNIIPSGTNWGSPIKLVSFPGERAVLKPNAGAYRVLEFDKAQSYIWVDGIDLDGSACLYDTVKVNAGSGYNAHHIRISNAAIKRGAHEQGVILTALILGNLGGNEFLNITMTGSGSSDFDNGFYIQSPDNLFSGCTVLGGPGAGFQIYNGYLPAAASRNTIQNCRAQGMSSMSQRGQGFVVFRGDGNRVLNCIAEDIRGNASKCCGAFQVDSGATNTLLQGNTAKNSQVPAVFIGPGAKGTIVKCTTYTNNYQDLVNQGQNTVVDQAGCGGSIPPPPPTNPDVTQTQPPTTQPLPPYQPPSTDQPSGPTTSGVAMPFLIAGVIGLALILGSD